MATIINASNSTGLTLTSDLSGVLQLQQNGVALPALSVAPAFSAYASATTTIPNNSKTKINFATEEFDTNNNFASSRFTPTVAGYYQINACAYIGGSTGFTQIIIQKNGGDYKSGILIPNISAVGGVSNVGSIVYLNGSTDYIEIVGYQNTGSSQDAQALQAYTYFNGCLVRGA